MKFNLNDNITVKLTEKGQTIWNANYPYNKIKNCVLTEQAWKIFNIFGQYLTMGLPYLIYPGIEIIKE